MQGFGTQYFTGLLFRLDPSAGGLAAGALLGAPTGLASDGAGGYFVCAKSSNAVRRVLQNGTITLFAGSYSSGATGDGGPATLAKLNGINGVALDTGPGGGVFLAVSSAYPLGCVCRGLSSCAANAA